MNDPTSLESTSAEPTAFNDSAISALVSGVPTGPDLQGISGQHGYLLDPAFATEIENVTKRLPERYDVTIRLHLAGAIGAFATGAIETDNGVVIARRAWQTEGTDKFLLPGRDSRNLSVLDYEYNLTPGDTDIFTATVLTDPSRAANLTLRFGRIPYQVSTASLPRYPLLFRPAPDTFAAVTVVRNPQGRCRTTRARATAELAIGSAERLVGIIRGALWQPIFGFVGYLKGAVGYSPLRREEALFFKAIDPSGTMLYVGALAGTIDKTRVGVLRNAQGIVGSFVVRGAPIDLGGGRFELPLRLRIHTECR